MKISLKQLANEYNLYAKQKYKRLLWKNLTQREIASYTPLREVVLNWVVENKKITEDEKIVLEQQLVKKALKLSQQNITVLNKNDMPVIIDKLLHGQLVVIPNGKIYVIFGVDDPHYTYKTMKKINADKVRHAYLPIVRLASVKNIPYERVQNPSIQKFLDLLVNSFQPIGLLLPDKKQNKKSMYVFYGGNFFEKLISNLRQTAKTPIDIYVSSANITTTGANTTAVGVLKDFFFSKYISAVVDSGDLKQQSQGNNSTTIITCSDKGELEYFRIGYPSKENIDAFASKHGVIIRKDTNTRTTFTR